MSKITTVRINKETQFLMESFMIRYNLYQAAIMPMILNDASLPYYQKLFLSLQPIKRVKATTNKAVAIDLHTSKLIKRLAYKFNVSQIMVMFIIFNDLNINSHNTIFKLADKRRTKSCIIKEIQKQDLTEIQYDKIIEILFGS